MRGFFAVALLVVSPALLAQGQPDHVIKSIYFGGGSYYIDPGQGRSLQDLLDSIPDLRYHSITIHSHTDNIGGAEYNQWLSEMRSESVVHKLLELDILEESIQIKDFGQFNPVYDNDSWLGRMKNRRVDIIFWPVVL
ncbi:MAG: OmpA family protein [Cyclobacteriaceae bacterium]|nr:OmpA family protein [Cyclobacteriaceae bacterium HetDA_MAG_MS6]